jgi:hypothetical protein
MKINVALNEKDAIVFDRVKKRIGIRTNAETMRYLITNYAQSEGLMSADEVVSDV